MKLFCAYAFTGEDLADVTKRMQLVVSTLNQGGHTTYCNLFDPRRRTLVGTKSIMAYALGTLEKYDAIVVIVASERRSEGQLMEIGAALALGKPVFLVQHKSAVGKSYISDLATRSFEWETLEDLEHALNELGEVIAQNPGAGE